MVQRMMLILLCGVVLSACGSWRQAKVYPGMHVAGESIVRPELQSLTAGRNPHLKVVLRVPESPKYMTQEAQKDMSRYYDWFEREIAKAGFIVRDRTLLEKILSGDKTGSYTGIAQAVDTDLIIEILYMGPCDLTHGNYYDTRDGAFREITRSPNLKKAFASSKFKMNGGRLDCRIITVKDGAVSGMFTLYNLPNEGICDFEVSSNKVCRNPEPNPAGIQGYGVGSEEQNIRALAALLVQTLQEGEVAVRVIQHGGLAEKYRIKPNDVIVKVNGQPVNTVPQAVTAIMRADGKVDLLLRRDGQEVPVTLTKRFGEPLGVRLAYRFTPRTQPEPVAAAPEEKKTDMTVALVEPAEKLAPPVVAPAPAKKRAAAKPAVKKKKAPPPATTFVANYKNQK